MDDPYLFESRAGPSWYGCFVATLPTQVQFLPTVGVSRGAHFSSLNELAVLLLLASVPSIIKKEEIKSASRPPSGF
jgi:hypothetical protein